MDNPESQKEKKKADPVDADRMMALLQLLKNSIDKTPEDMDQDTLIQMVQKNRAFVLEFTMNAYLDNPKNAHLLEGVHALLTQMEKVVRDNRKEALKKKESESNAISFNQMMEAIGKISTGSQMPTFSLENFILDPSKALVPEGTFFNPINQHELEQGNKLVDIDGNPI